MAAILSDGSTDVRRDEHGTLSVGGTPVWKLAQVAKVVRVADPPAATEKLDGAGPEVVAAQPDANLTRGLNHRHRAILWTLHPNRSKGTVSLADLCVGLDSDNTPDVKTARRYVRQLATRKPPLAHYVEGEDAEITDDGCAAIAGWEPLDTAHPWRRPSDPTVKGQSPQKFPRNSR